MHHIMFTLLMHASIINVAGSMNMEAIRMQVCPTPSFYLLMCYQNISQSCLYVFIVVVGLCPQLSTKCHLMCRVLLLVTIVPSFVTIYQLNEVFFRFMFITFILYIWPYNLYIDDQSCLHFQTAGKISALHKNK